MASVGFFVRSFTIVNLTKSIRNFFNSDVILKCKFTSHMNVLYSTIVHIDDNAIYNKWDKQCQTQSSNFNI